jgi:hypothetical protein
MKRVLFTVVVVLKTGKDRTMDVYIYKSIPGPSAKIQRCKNGKPENALNWAELSQEALQAIEPEIRRRWLEYWEYAARKAATVCDTTSIDEIMGIIMLPSHYYPCPAELAQKAIWKEDATPGVLRIVEGSVSC